MTDICDSHPLCGNGMKMSAFVGNWGRGRRIGGEVDVTKGRRPAFSLWTGHRQGVAGLGEWTMNRVMLIAVVLGCCLVATHAVLPDREGTAVSDDSVGCHFWTGAVSPARSPTANWIASR